MLLNRHIRGFYSILGKFISKSFERLKRQINANSEVLKMDINTLYEKRANLWENAKNFLDSHTDKDGLISEEDSAAYEKMENDIIALGKQIERYQRKTSMDNYLEQPTSKPILENPNATATFNAKTGRASNEYRQAALTALRTNFRKVDNYLQEGTDSAGGYLVPEEWDSRLIQGLEEENIMRSLGTTITTSGERKINIAGSRPASAWIDEGAPLIFNDTTFGQTTISAHKLQVGIKVTNELLYDAAFPLESYILDMFTKEFAAAEEDAFLNGLASDTSKPTGLFETASADSDTVVTTAGASIAADDIINLVYKLKRPYRKSAVFIMNDQTLGALRKLKDGQGNFLWQPSYTEGDPDRLLGYQIYTSAYAPAIAAGKPAIAFGDMSYYNIADRGARSFTELRELYMGNDMTGFVMIERVDGLLLLPEAVRVLKVKA